MLRIEYKENHAFGSVIVQVIDQIIVAILNAYIKHVIYGYFCKHMVYAIEVMKINFVLIKPRFCILG